MDRSREDERLGQALKAVRRRNGLTQYDLSRAAGVARRTLRRIEDGGADGVRLGAIRSVFEAAGASVRTTSWWNGAALDRLLDERHARLVERAVGMLRRAGWRVEVEVRFNVFGDRGSIDLMGGHDQTRSLLVGEVKASVGSMEEMNRSFDVKVRHAPGLAQERFGWRPAAVARVLILPDESTIRRIVARNAATLDSAYPVRGRAVRAWIHQPVGPLRGIWFLSDGPRVAQRPTANRAK